MPPWIETLIKLFIAPSLDTEGKSPAQIMKQRSAFRRWTLVISAACIGLMFHTMYALGLLPWTTGYAKAENISASITDLQKDVAKANNSRRFDAMTTEMRRLDQAIFDVDSRINDQKSRGKEPDGFYYQRLQDLKTTRGEVERSLTAFAQMHPDLAANSAP